MINNNDVVNPLQNNHRLLSARLYLSRLRYSIGSCIPSTMLRVTTKLGISNRFRVMNTALDIVPERSAGQALRHDRELFHESVGLGVGELVTLLFILLLFNWLSLLCVYCLIALPAEAFACSPLACGFEGLFYKVSDDTIPTITERDVFGDLFDLRAGISGGAR